MVVTTAGQTIDAPGDDIRMRLATPPRRRRATHRSRHFANLPVAALLAIASLLAAERAVSWSSLYWGITSVLAAAAGSLFAIGSTSSARQAGVFLPFTFIGLWAVGFGFASIIWRNPNNEALELNTALRPESVPPGLALAAAGLLAWTTGYCFLNLRLLHAALAWLRRWSTNGRERQPSLVYSLKRIMCVYAIGLGARFVLLALGQYSYITSDLQSAITHSSPFTSLVSHVESLTAVALLLLAYLCFHGQSSASKRWLVLVLMIEVPFGLLGGMRSFILLRLIGVAVTYFLVRRRVPVAATLAFFAVLALISPFTDAYRSEVREGGSTTVDAAGAAELIPSLLVTTFRAVSAEDLVLAPKIFVTERLRFVDEVAMVHQEVPSRIAQIPPETTILEASTVLIPRAAWPGKPVYTIGLQYARDFWNQPPSVISARSPTLPGEAFYRGGWPGVLIFMALVGAAMRAVNAALSPKLYAGTVPLFLSAWTEFVDIEVSLVLLAAGLAQSLLITAVTMRWTTRSLPIGVAQVSHSMMSER